MTLRSKLPLYLYQKYFAAKDTLSSFLNKLEVITNSNAIIYSVRILIVLLALLMGYLHKPKDKNEISNANKIEIIKDTSKTGFIEMKR